VTLLADALALTHADRAAFAAARRRGKSTAAGAPPTHPAEGSPLPFVGRGAELAVLDRHLCAVGSPLLCVTGEPGIGKTRLLREAARRGLERGWTVLIGGCHRRSGQEPYTPFLAALERHLNGQAVSERRAALRECAWLARLLPELTEVAPPLAAARELPAEHARRLAFAAVVCYLVNSAGPAGTLLVLDDLHWAGCDALDLLAFLIGASAERPLRIVGAYRDTEVRPGSPLAVVLADLAREALVTRLPLGPLAADDAAHLLDELLAEASAAGAGGAKSANDSQASETAALRAQLLQRTGGVPFVLISYVQGARRGARPRPDRRGALEHRRDGAGASGGAPRAGVRDGGGRGGGGPRRPALAPACRYRAYRVRGIAGTGGGDPRPATGGRGRACVCLYPRPHS
jgi:hypothetical protein